MKNKSVNKGSSVVCIARGMRDYIDPQKICFNSGKDLTVHVHGKIGPHGISTTAADLIDIGAAVFEIERQLRGRQRTNPVSSFEVTFRVRDSVRWTGKSAKLLSDILTFMGTPVWNIRLESGLTAPIPSHETHEQQTAAAISEVALFSGGLDSACGALTLGERKALTQLTSYYTGQKSLQTELAQAFGFSPPVQWSLRWHKEPGRGHSYFYRSFLFLALGAAVADSWRARTILQFENGVLASSIPPSPSFAMTRHAHPKLQAACAELFSQVFGGKWTINNPFLLYTKKECMDLAVRESKRSKLKDIRPHLARTQTCWFYRSNRIWGDSKDPNTPCGVCIPCLVRRTAIPKEDYKFDLGNDRTRNDRRKGMAFRSYYGFLSRVFQCKSEMEFYEVLPAAGRNLLATGVVKLGELHRLYRQFEKEFMNTFHVSPEGR